MSNDPVNSPQVTEDVIRIRAYQLYEERGSQPGHQLDDWFQAEAEILAQKPPRAEPQKIARAAVAA